VLLQTEHKSEWTAFERELGEHNDACGEKDQQQHARDKAILVAGQQ
jgi:hypothetical protein